MVRHDEVPLIKCRPAVWMPTGEVEMDQGTGLPEGINTLFGAASLPPASASPSSLCAPVSYSSELLGFSAWIHLCGWRSSPEHGCLLHETERMRDLWQPEGIQILRAFPINEWFFIFCLQFVPFLRWDKEPGALQYMTWFHYLILKALMVKKYLSTWSQKLF